MINLYSAALCCGLIEANGDGSERTVRLMYSAALCCGLIEAWSVYSFNFFHYSIPQRYAAASLKQEVRGPLLHLVAGIPQRYAAASLKLVA